MLPRRTRWLALAWLVALRFDLPRRMLHRDLRDLLRGLEADRVWAHVPIDDAAKTIARAEALVRRARAVPDTCLYRALGRFSMLCRFGLPARFVMGVRKDDGALVGHAWVEVDGAPLLEAEVPRYEVTFAHGFDGAAGSDEAVAVVVAGLR